MQFMITDKKNYADIDNNNMISYCHYIFIIAVILIIMLKF